MKEPEYVQLSSWEELVSFIENAQRQIFGDDWQRMTAPPKRTRKKKSPPQEEGLF